MFSRLAIWIALSCLAAGNLEAQVDQQNRFRILGTLIADTAASRSAMPLGGEGIHLSESGEIDRDKLSDELMKEGRAIDEGQVVTITAISFDDDKIEIELNNGGQEKRSILSRIQVGVGSRTTPIQESNREPAKGSKIVLHFDDKAPVDLTVDMLRDFLSPLLDFNKQNFMDSGIESLPEEFQEAVREREAKIGMDRSTVLMALGRPNQRIRDETPEGLPQETWIYRKLGLGADFVYFEDDVVVRIVRY